MTRILYKLAVGKNAKQQGNYTATQALIKKGHTFTVPLEEPYWDLG